MFSKVRAKLGLDRTRICACSAAPITLDTLEFFLSLGIPILEIYGMSEVTGPAVDNTLAKVESIRRFHLLPGQFTIEGGELTPTMKLKRRVVHSKYEREIEALYS